MRYQLRQSPKYLFNFCASTETLCFFGDALPLSQKRYLIVFVFSFCFISDKSLILLSQLFAIVLTYSSSFAIAQLHSTQKPLGRVPIAHTFNFQSTKKRRHPDSNWGIKALQASALPLGHVALIRITNIRNTNSIVKISLLRC